MTEFINTVITGDCLIESDKIASGSVDLILTDLPYGNMKGINGGDTSWKNTNTEWDDAVDPKAIYAIANRILRKNGKMTLFSQEPYTSRLITEAIPNIPFSYRMVWEKDIYGNALFAKKAPLIFFEDVLVFSKSECYEAKHPLRKVMSKYVVEYGEGFIIDLFTKEGRYSTLLSARVHASYKFGFNNGMRFDLMDVKMYDYLHQFIDFAESYDELKMVDNTYKERYKSTFNLWVGGKYKSNILRYKKDYNGYHPTQKPVLLLEDLIKTFSNEGDTVVDLTAGSGSTAVAAINTNRNFIAIEQDEKYSAIARARIDEALTKIERGDSA